MSAALNGAMRGFSACRLSMARHGHNDTVVRAVSFSSGSVRPSDVIDLLVDLMHTARPLGVAWEDIAAGAADIYRKEST